MDLAEHSLVRTINIGREVGRGARHSLRNGFLVYSDVIFTADDTKGMSTDPGIA